MEERKTAPHVEEGLVSHFRTREPYQAEEAGSQHRSMKDQPLPPGSLP